MKISVITACFNAINTIDDCLLSVIHQTHDDLEHIIVDGNSVDGTTEYLHSQCGSNPRLRIISENDDGIYDAINKGIAAASGGIIAILNADDIYAESHVLSTVNSFFEENKSCDVFLSGISFFSKKINGVPMLTRRVLATKFSPYKLHYGWMPPHPGMFVRSEIYESLGPYTTKYKIAGDYEFCIRLFLKSDHQWVTSKFTTVLMREGGISTDGVRSNWLITKEIISACKEHQIEVKYVLLLLRLPVKFFTEVIMYKLFNIGRG